MPRGLFTTESEEYSRNGLYDGHYYFTTRARSLLAWMPPTVPGGDYFLTALTFENQSGVEISMIFALEKETGEALWEHSPEPLHYFNALFSLGWGGSGT